MKQKQRLKLLNAQLTNRHNKDIWDVIATLKDMRPIMADSIFKDGYDTCYDLLVRAVKQMEEPYYAKKIKELEDRLNKALNKQK